MNIPIIQLSRKLEANKHEKASQNSTITTRKVSCLRINVQGRWKNDISILAHFTEVSILNSI